MNKRTFNFITNWQKETFPNSNANSKIVHLKQEVDELQSDVMYNSIDARLEFADCFILLFGAAKAHGMSYEDICAAIDEKMHINVNRKWGKPDKNGVVNHIKNETNEPK